MFPTSADAIPTGCYTILFNIRFYVGSFCPSTLCLRRCRILVGNFRKATKIEALEVRIYHILLNRHYAVMSSPLIVFGSVQNWIDECDSVIHVNVYVRCGMWEWMAGISSAFQFQQKVNKSYSLNYSNSFLLFQTIHTNPICIRIKAPSRARDGSWWE